ncbi:MAG: hypothetical protein JW931_03430 [Methanomicrobiaceae archaeon]|nr:hypothetical protein [Methanomicrobiaceae archaeon]
MKRRFLKKWAAWLLLLVTVIMLLSGFGITHYWIIGPATLGIIGKAESFRIHTILWAPFLILLILHIYYAKIPPGK